MATSGSTDFNQTALTLVQDAHYLLNITQHGQSLPNEDFTLSLRALNRMIKHWQVKGIHLWRYTEGSLSTVADTQSYTMGSGGDFSTERPLKITSMRHVENSIDTPMRPLNREDYFDQPNKAATGKPISYYYDPQGGATALGTLYIWPTDDSANTLKFTYVRQFEDFDAGANNPDVPQEWLDCIVHNLAVRLAPFYGVNAREVTTGDSNLVDAAALMLEECQGYSREDPGSIFIEPDYQFM